MSIFQIYLDGSFPVSNLPPSSTLSSDPKTYIQANLKITFIQNFIPMSSDYVNKLLISV